MKRKQIILLQPILRSFYDLGEFIEFATGLKVDTVKVSVFFNSSRGLFSIPFEISIDMMKDINSISMINEIFNERAIDFLTKN